MNASPYEVRNMLQTYGRQATTALRLARYRRSLRAAEGEDEVTISREAKRQELVLRVATEIVENLITAGSENPVVEEIKLRLEEAVGSRLVFAYPPEEQDLQIFKVLGPDEYEEIEAQAKKALLDKLWRITLETVDETMV